MNEWISFRGSEDITVVKLKYFCILLNNPIPLGKTKVCGNSIHMIFEFSIFLIFRIFSGRGFYVADAVICCHQVNVISLCLKVKGGSTGNRIRGQDFSEILMTRLCTAFLGWCVTLKTSIHSSDCPPTVAAILWDQPPKTFSMLSCLRLVHFVLFFGQRSMQVTSFLFDFRLWILRQPQESVL